jgi:hypothetical protein
MTNQLSGTFPLSARLRGVRGSAIRDLLTFTARPDVLSLAGGLPASDALPRERIAVAAERALRSPTSVQYGETAGLADLREVVAAHEAGRMGRPVAAADVVVTSGSQQALDLLARAVVDPGDPVVVEDPAYVGALQVFQAAGADLHAVPLDADGMDLDALEALLRGGLRPRLVHTVSSFHNPRGVTMAQARRSRPSSPTGTGCSSSRTTRTACSPSTARRPARSPRTATAWCASAARRRSSRPHCGSAGSPARRPWSPRWSGCASAPTCADPR